MRDIWERWGWAVALVVFAAIIVVLLYGRAPFCEPEEVCVREWLGALSGWAAVAAAVPTVYYLSRQIREAERHHRENLRPQLETKYANAKAIVGMAGMVRTLIHRFTQQNPASTNPSAFISAFQSDVQKPLTMVFSTGVFDFFDQAFVYPGNITLSTVRQSLAEDVGKLAASVPTETIVKNARVFLSELDDQLASMITVGETFIDQADKMLSSEA